MDWLSLPNGAMGINLWGSLTSKLDGYPIDLNPSPAGPSQSMKKIAWQFAIEYHEDNQTA